MDERKVVRDLILKATEVAMEHRVDHLTAVTIRVGALSQVAPGSIAARIIDAAAGIPLEDARIEMVRGPGGPAAAAVEHAADVVLQSVEIGGR
jgi:Zn finger protein HypA/HybF involved in hydrogenase expression